VTGGVRSALARRPLLSHRELLAQVDWFRSAGISLDHPDRHTGSTLPAAYAEVSERTAVPFLHSNEVRRGLVSISELSPRDAAEKWMLAAQQADTGRTAARVRPRRGDF